MLELFALLKKKITSSSRCTSGPEKLNELSIYLPPYNWMNMRCMVLGEIEQLQKLNRTAQRVHDKFLHSF